MTNLAIRLSGLTMIVGAIFLGVAIVMVSLNPFGSQSITPLPISLSLFLASILLLPSLPTMYAKQASSAGWLGIVGHALLQTGMLVIVVTSSTSLRYLLFNPSGGAENAVDFFLGIALTLGLLLTTIATIRASVFPRGAGILLLAVTAGFFSISFAELLPSVVGQVGVAVLGILLALAFARFGFSIKRENTMTTTPSDYRRMLFVTTFTSLSWLGMILHNLQELPQLTLLNPEELFPTPVYVVLLGAYVWMPSNRITISLLLLWGLLHLIGGGIASVIPLPFLPFYPGQSLHHYLSHVVYSVAQVPLIVLLWRELRMLRVTHV